MTKTLYILHYFGRFKLCLSVALPSVVFANVVVLQKSCVRDVENIVTTSADNNFVVILATIVGHKFNKTILCLWDKFAQFGSICRKNTTPHSLYSHKQNYVDSVPLRKSKKKRRECPVAASVLFRNNGPHVTGKANMAAIAAYDKAKREEAAAKAARRLATKQKRAHKRQEGTMEVVKLAVQQILLTQTPPLQYYDESHDVVSRPFKPDTHDCKKFMQVSECVYV